jgi:glycerate kinase
MKIVIAPDSFKGSASSSEISTWIEKGIHSVIPDCETHKIAIGDGGEGSLDAVLLAGFTAHEVEVVGPVGNPVTAEIAIKGDTAFIEMAQASGLSQLPGGNKSALSASSFGTGQLILAALNHGVTKIVLAIGGTATTDAGAGALQALGAKLLDASRDDIAAGGAALINCAHIDTSNLDLRLPGISFTLASDVTNPLLGDNGAARVFSPQKGATPEQVEVLEKSLTHFASLVGGEYATKPGSGAAGGFGFMAYAFLKAKAQSGIDLILDLVEFDSKIKGADFIITGEGRFDSQSVQGKAPWGILQRASKLSIPTYLVCGDADTHQTSGFAGIHTLTSIESDIYKCINNPAPLVTQLGAKIAELIQGN